MQRLIIAFLLSWVFLTGVVAQDTNLFEKKLFISSKGDSLPYRILYPENYDPAKKYPLVLFLHGAGERGNDNEKQLVHGSKLFLADSNRSRYPAIVVFPQCPENSFWAAVKVNREKQPFEINFNYGAEMTAPLRSVTELTKQLIKEAGVHKKKVYITGLSMGGMGTFEMVYREPKLFAAAAPICGGGDIASYNKKTAKVPFWVFHGADDSVVDAKLSRQMVDRLKALNADVEYSEYPGVNHNSWDNAFAEPQFLSWMFSQRK